MKLVEVHDVEIPICFLFQQEKVSPGNVGTIQGSVRATSSAVHRKGNCCRAAVDALTTPSEQPTPSALAGASSH